MPFMNRKITDIYATSIDYDPTQEININFFKTVQNKSIKNLDDAIPLP